MNLPVLVFDIETIPDTNAGAQLYGLNLSPEDTLLAMNNLRRQECDSDFPRLPLHEIACISCLWVDKDQFRLFSLCQKDQTEAQILSRFLNGFDKNPHCIVSWNGHSFDLPVLTLRALYHGLSAKTLFDQGEFDAKRKHNNYANRYHACHIDLMDSMAWFNPRNFQKLDDVAVFLGFPGKQGQSGYQVSELVKQQQWDKLCQYCESDVLNTWLIYLRWQLLRGHITVDEHQTWLTITQDYLATQPQQHNFLANWQHNSRANPYNPPVFNDT